MLLEIEFYWKKVSMQNVGSGKVGSESLTEATSVLTLVVCLIVCLLVL